MLIFLQCLIITLPLDEVTHVQFGTSPLTTHTAWGSGRSTEQVRVFELGPSPQCKAVIPYTGNLRVVQWRRTLAEAILAIRLH